MILADEKPVELFNKLIGINNNRIECYSFAGKQVESNLFKTLFTRLVDTSLFCRETLTAEVYKLGGQPLEGTLSNTSFFRSWLRMHDALMKKNNRLLMESCYAAEEVVEKTTRSLCREHWMLLNTFQRKMLEDQLAMMSADFGCASNLRNVFNTAA